MGERAYYTSMMTTIFEQRTYQKQIGAYYTKEDVAAYIARNTIIPHLFDATRERCPAAFAPEAAMWRLLQDEPERYIPDSIRQSGYLPTETEREYAARRSRHQQLCTLLKSGAIDSIEALVTCNLAIQQFARDVLTSCTDPALLLAFYTSMERVTILDPTCGPGAFLFAALNLLAPLYATCLDRMQKLFGSRASAMPPLSISHALDHSTDEMCRAILKRSEQYTDRDYYILHTIITNNLYGVDLMPEAVEACRQRLLLALLAHIEHASASESLPMLDNHIRVGNALVSSLWPAEFPTVMERGGFDVIIGNPPYIEYSKVRQNYRAGSYEAGNCGNLYAAVVERSLALCRSQQSYIGLIVPLSLCGSERFAPLRRTILDQTAARWLANFEIFPARLFNDAFQRLSILIARRDDTRKHGSTYVTRIQRWYAAERPHLLDLISYTEVQRSIRPGVFPKLASPLQETILHKVLERAGGTSIATALTPERTPHFVYYQEATNYWMKAICRVPFYKKNGIIMEPPHGRFLFFNGALTARTIMAVMNSSLFYLWFVTYSDGFHLSHMLVKEFPAGSDLYGIEELPLLSTHLEEDIQRYARLGTRNTRATQKKTGHLIELEEYKMGYSRPIIDEIDRVLAKHYGFTDDELDFIMNYDIKYRLGLE